MPKMKPLRIKGKERNRRPVAANRAFATAGATGGTASSPIPPTGDSEGKILDDAEKFPPATRIQAGSIGGGFAAPEDACQGC